MAELLEEEQDIKVSAETIRRVLHRLGFVWRRPRPIVGPIDPDYDQKLRKIRRLLSTLPADEVAVFQDEVDVNLNPRIGSQWMLRGDQMKQLSTWRLAAVGNDEWRLEVLRCLD